MHDLLALVSQSLRLASAQEVTDPALFHNTAQESGVWTEENIAGETELQRSSSVTICLIYSLEKT